MAAAGSVFSRAELDYLHGQRLLGRIATVATATTLDLRGAALLALIGAVVAILILPQRNAPIEPSTHQPKEQS